MLKKIKSLLKGKSKEAQGQEDVQGQDVQERRPDYAGFLAENRLFGNAFTSSQDGTFKPDDFIEVFSQDFENLVETSQVISAWHTPYRVLNVESQARRYWVKAYDEDVKAEEFNPKPDAIIRGSKTHVIWSLPYTEQGSFLHEVAELHMIQGIVRNGDAVFTEVATSPCLIPVPCLSHETLEVYNLRGHAAFAEEGGLTDELMRLGKNWTSKATTTTQSKQSKSQPKPRRTSVEKVVRSVVGSHVLHVFHAEGLFRQIGIELAKKGIEPVEKTGEILSTLYAMDSDWVAQNGDFAQVANWLREGERLAELQD